MSTHELAQNAFNNINIIKGQVVNIATADEQGIPSVAPIGSMRMVDSSTVHICQGMLPRTMANLKKNPKATFSVYRPPSMWDMLKMLKSDGEDTMGYRAYCTYTGAATDPKALEVEVAAIKKRVPFFMRSPLERFFDKIIKQVLVFKIDDIRAIR